MQTNLTQWDRRFLQLCKLVASWSKDPSTGVGCILVDQQNRLISTGFNGLPAGVKDTEKRLNDRETKISIVIHAEENALLFAKGSTVGCTAYIWPLPPCASCASKLIQSGVKRIVSIAPEVDTAKRWRNSFTMADTLYAEAGVIVDIEEGVLDG